MYLAAFLHISYIYGWYKHSLVMSSTNEFEPVFIVGRVYYSQSNDQYWVYIPKLIADTFDLQPGDVIIGVVFVARGQKGKNRIELVIDWLKRLMLSLRRGR